MRRQPLLAILTAVLVAGSSGCAAAVPTPTLAPPLSVSTPTGEPTMTITPTASSSPASVSTAAPTPTLAPAPSPTSWLAVPDQASVSEVEFQDVVWTGARFVAIGAAGDRAAFLDSNDGIVWDRQAGEATGSGPGILAAGPSGLVAVGSIDGRLASWTSPDGLAWKVHPTAFPPAPDGSRVDEDSVRVTDVVATDHGWLAVGRRDPACQFNCDLAPSRAYVWTSSDGSRWSRVAADQKALKGGGMDAVTRVDDGFVAAGIASGHAAIWTSADGSAWSRVPDAPMFHPTKDLYQAGIDVAERDGVIVMIGTIASQDAASVRAWWSADGRTWSTASVENGPDASVERVVATADGFLAPGWSVDCPGTSSDENLSHGAIWVSTDGRAWRCEPLDPGPEGFSPAAAAVSETIAVVVGWTDPGDEDSSLRRSGAVWYRSRP